MDIVRGVPFLPEVVLPLLEAIPLPAVVALDARAHEVRGNAALSEALGVPPESYAPLRDALAGALAGGAPSARLELERPDGSVRHMIASVTLLHGPDGDVRGALAVLQDVGRHVEMERFLFELARLTPALLFTADSSGRIDFVNARWVEVIGVAAHELLGGGWIRFVHPDDLARLTPLWEDAVRDGRHYVAQWRFRRPDGTYRWIEIRAEPERDDEGGIARWFGSGADVDIQRRALDQLQELYEHERHVANSFQRAALPTQLPSLPGFRFDAIYEAARSEALVGGDWYDAFQLPDGRIVVSIGDVAGAGLQAAVTMANVRQTIRGVSFVHPDPGIMLEAADRTLRADEPNRFVTAFVAVIDPVGATLIYANAGHPRPYVRDPAGTLKQLEGADLPLGLHGHEKAATLRYEFLPGSLLVLYTDGLVEQTHDIEEGERRLEAALCNPNIYLSEKPATALKNALLREGSRDDVAILVVESPDRGAALRRLR